MHTKVNQFPMQDLKHSLFFPPFFILSNERCDVDGNFILTSMSGAKYGFESGIIDTNDESIRECISLTWHNPKLLFSSTNFSVLAYASKHSVGQEMSIGRDCYL